MTARKPRASAEASAPDTVNGWTLLFHPLFLRQIDTLLSKIENAAKRGRPAKADLAVNAAIHKLVFADIPADPSSAAFRQGKTLGTKHTHWRRGKFGNGRFRLFFRYLQAQRVIAIIWVNDTETLRTYGSARDAYAVFARMLASGRPPDSWEDLVAECDATRSAQYVKRHAPKPTEPITPPGAQTRLKATPKRR
jgi:toxin YhaV